MANPVTSIRLAPQHRGVIKRVVSLLNSGQGDRLAHLLDDLDRAPLGPYRSAEAAIADAVARLAAQLDPEEIWLFGSRARRDHHPDSDIDLLVILPDGLPRERYTLRAARQALLGGGAPIDVFPVARSSFENDPAALGGLVAVAKSEGKRIYQKLGRG